MKRLILLTLALLLLAAPAAAYDRYQSEQVTYYSIDAPADRTIVSTIVNNCPPNSEQVIVLDAYGDLHTLTVNSTRNTIGWWTFTVDYEYPNGTIAQQSFSTLEPFANFYNAKIQPYYGVDSWILRVDVYVSINPFKITGNKLEYDHMIIPQYMAYSSTTVTSSDPVDIEVHMVDEEAWEIIASGGDVLHRWSQSTKKVIGDALQWTWDTVLWFVEKIPFVGTFLVTTLILIALLADEIFFWLNFFLIEHLVITILTVEFLIITESSISTRSLVALLNRIMKHHTNLFHFTVNALEKTASLLLSVYRTVALIVTGLRPV